MRKNSPAAICALAVSLFAAGAARGADFTVTNTNTSGPGSLHQAITDANALPGPDRIVFNIPGTGVRKITTGRSHPLPNVSDTLTIDGYTQPGSRPNNLEIGSNAVVRIQVSGTPVVGLPVSVPAEYGLTLEAPGCVVRGVMVTGFTNGYGYSTVYGYGINVAAENCRIEGNLIGTNGSPDPSYGIQGRGVLISGASGTLIGGDTPAARNVIGGSQTGIYVPSATGLVIAGNQIGSNPPGAAHSIAHEALGNYDGIYVGFGPSAVQIGGTTPGLGNLISGNRTGMVIFSGVTVQGNAIGLQPRRGSTAETNQDIAIVIGGVDNMIGGLAAGTGNEIAHNKTGVYVGFGSRVRNAILSNRIYANENMAINLESEDLGNGAKAGGGPTANDPGDSDTGANNLQNYPVITSTQPGGSIKGVLNSTPNSEFTLQFFRYNLDPQVLGNLVVHTDANGNADFDFSYVPPPDPSQPGEFYSATATDAEGNTSEMSPGRGAKVANLSTRARVQPGDRAMVGGFIITGSDPKTVVLRAIGPSLDPASTFDPVMEVHDGSGNLIATNDNWEVSDSRQQVIDSGLAPTDPRECALWGVIDPGAYTVVVRGKNEASGTAVVEVYDLDRTGDSKLANISTRAFVGTGDDVLIGGFIITGDDVQKVIVRALGPSVGVAGAMANPTLAVRDGNGGLVGFNDNWRTSQEAEIMATSIPPRKNAESAIVRSLGPGGYTAIVEGANGATGVALVEVYALP